MIYLATLSGISPEYYEAAKVDGANRMQQIRYVTLPGLANTIVILLVLQIGGPRCSCGRRGCAEALIAELREP